MWKMKEARHLSHFLWKTFACLLHLWAVFSEALNFTSNDTPRRWNALSNTKYWITCRIRFSKVQNYKTNRSFDGSLRDVWTQETEAHIHLFGGLRIQFHDCLTVNYLADNFVERYSASRQFQALHAVVFMDLDRFKDDLMITCGIDVGDQLLCCCWVTTSSLIRR